jgi:hypothetical protein
MARARLDLSQRELADVVSQLLKKAGSKEKLTQVGVSLSERACLPPPPTVLAMIAKVVGSSSSELLGPAIDPRPLAAAGGSR